MKKGLWVLVGLLAGCSSPWVYAPAPAEPVSAETAAVASGVLEPQQFYFTLISQYQQGSARVVVLTDPAVKLADMTISQGQMIVHYRAPKVPAKLIKEWGRLVRAYLLRPCPPRQIVEQTAALQGAFKLEVKGGVCL